MHEISLSDVSSLVGQELGTSKWITIDQAMINLFADATHDHQFIHVDPNAQRQRVRLAARSLMVS